MLTLRRISTIYQYLHPLSSCQYRFKSKQSGDDESKGKSSRLSEELLNFERKNINTSRNVMKDHKNPPNEAKVEKKRSITRETLMKGDGRQAKDLLRSLNVKNSNHQKQSLEQRDRSSSNDRVNLAKPFDTKERKQNREGEHDGEKD
ncbi:unnamed protein product, partial [Rotaria magnacalcarata]